MSKVLVATYNNESLFVIPKGLAKIIDNKDFVEEYWVRWNTLYIKLTNGETIEIQEKAYTEHEQKCPDIIQIEDIENYPYLQNE